MLRYELCFSIDFEDGRDTTAEVVRHYYKMTRSDPDSDSLEIELFRVFVVLEHRREFVYEDHQ